jgi:hypothetical protein
MFLSIGDPCTAQTEAARLSSRTRARRARRHRIGQAILLASCGLLAAAWPALQVEAASVLPMTVATLSDYAGQAIVGDVAAVRSYWADQPRRIESEITFEKVEYLKGALPDSKSTFPLIVPGGVVGGWQMRIGGAPTFAVGERWVLFLLPSYKTFPVVGLHQGALRIEQDADGVARVYDASRRPVTGLDADGLIQAVGNVAADLPIPAPGPGEGRPPTANAAPAAAKDGTPAAQENLIAANGVRIRFVGPPSPPPQAISYDDFVALIRPVLERSKAYALSAPAGKPELQRYVAVPMQRSPSAPRPGAQDAAGARAAEPVVRGSAALPRKVDAQPRNPSGSAKEVQP